MALKVGDTAPDFTLADQNRNNWTLSSFRGVKKVLVVFFPLPFTGRCQSELNYLRDTLPAFQNDRVEVIAISVGSVPSHKVWASMQGYLFPILADFWPHGETAKAYDVFDEENGVACRGTFLIDTDGVIIFSNAVVPSQGRDQSLWDTVEKALES